MSTLTFGTWAILPLSVALRDLKDADHLTITRRRNGPRVEMMKRRLAYFDADGIVRYEA